MSYLTGFHAIEERIKSGRSAVALLAARAGPRARELMTLAGKYRIPVNRVGACDLDRVAPGNRGIALELADIRESGVRDPAPEEFIAGLGDRPDALVVVLDEITDPHNYGAILRSCDQFGVDLVLTRNRRSAKHAGVVARTSSGADAWVPATEVPNLIRAVQDLKDAGFWIYGADMAGDAVYTKDLCGRAAIILGAEGTGISRLLRESCDALIAIPGEGRIDSLNVSVAAGILLYEVSRQRSQRRA
ncbi:MAG: 23S rRNA (guanosine(2251)-2'-O)-methyltransferase RlmB [Spirochaetaceae bacterium]|jgi:23S rRNA (guanosine2251-2'-O)-methyltransferase|nr:23S rRNA (guanosine(2251)-2'-O)-methyltransferase RlmB [Spirochaetaceae bacterium]